jgi:hypothetical protein
MAPNLPKEYKVAVFKEKGANLTFEQRPLEPPKPGHVQFIIFAWNVC